MSKYHVVFTRVYEVEAIGEDHAIRVASLMSIEDLDDGAESSAAFEGTQVHEVPDQKDDTVRADCSPPKAVPIRGPGGYGPWIIQATRWSNNADRSHTSTQLPTFILPKFLGLCYEDAITTASGIVGGDEAFIGVSRYEG